jgi:branched-chain amino acid transport system ATP-binding protein/branched-chain amino acid transport system permease protein
VSIALRLTDVSRSFGGVQAVSNLSLDVDAATIAALLGPNGAGKSTLFNMVSGFIHPDSGHISYAGRRIEGLSATRIARLGIGRFFQDVRLFQAMTGLENVLVALQQPSHEGVLQTLFNPPRRSARERQLREQAYLLLEQLHLQAMADRRASDLSYGQQKLLALARLLALDARLLLLDEPLAGLAPPVLEHMLNIIRAAAAAGRTVLLIEHNLDAVRRVADSIVFMSQGRLLTHGAVDEVLADARLADEYLGTPA